MARNGNDTSKAKAATAAVVDPHPWTPPPLDDALKVRIHDHMVLARATEEMMIRMMRTGHGYFWIGGAKVSMPDIPGSDCNGVRDGYVTVTPIGDDLTRTDSLAALTAHFTPAKEMA